MLSVTFTNTGILSFPKKHLSKNFKIRGVGLGCKTLLEKERMRFKSIHTLSRNVFTAGLPLQECKKTYKMNC